MDPVKPLSQLMQALRQQLATQAQKPGRTTRQETDHQPSTPTPPMPVAGKASLEQVHTRIRERIKQLDPDQRDNLQAAQIFVESILVWEFGEELLQDPRFQEMSKEVQETMMGDPDTWERFQGLLQNLQK